VAIRKQKKSLKNRSSIKAKKRKIKKRKIMGGAKKNTLRDEIMVANAESNKVE